MKMLVMTMMLSREVMGEEHLEAVPVDKLPPPKVPLQVASHHCQSSDNCAPQKIISPSHKMNHRLPNTRVLLWEVWTTLFKIASLLLQNRFLRSTSRTSPHHHKHHQSKIAFHSCLKRFARDAVDAITIYNLSSSPNQKLQFADRQHLCKLTVCRSVAPGAVFFKLCHGTQQTKIQAEIS